MEAIRLWKYQGYKTLVTLSLYYVLGTSLCLMSQEKLNCSPRFANVRMSSFIAQTNQQNPAKAGNPTNTLDYFFPQKCVETVYWYTYIVINKKFLVTSFWRDVASNSPIWLDIISCVIPIAPSEEFLIHRHVVMNHDDLITLSRHFSAVNVHLFSVN